jgi:DNA primase
LWDLLPAGILKQQLLSELASLVQLSTRELSEIWSPDSRPNTTKDPKRQPKDGKFSNPYSGKKKASQQTSRLGRTASGGAAPTSRADHAARLMMDNMTVWESLSAEDQAMLRQLPAPHGALFSWLEGQYHEHGAQTWAVLREGLRETLSETLALQLMDGFEFGNEADLNEVTRELRHLLNRMLIDHLKIQETLAIDSAKSDPSALAHYRDLQARRRALEASLESASAI